ncbi:hypothetical protein [Sphingopyxis sp.]|uniref:hypothetical protein n=1 Tax=Sphingopyxis sp. TaxID=1908224 RepID=UPI003D0F9F43
MGQSLSGQDFSNNRDWDRIEVLENEVLRLVKALERMSKNGAGLDFRSDDRKSCLTESKQIGLRDVPDLRKSESSEKQHSFYDDLSPSVYRARQVRERIRQRRLREQKFSADLFSDPAWDMMLDLYAAQQEGGDVSVSSLCIAAAVPATTALRWIKRLTDEGWLVREDDTRDQRRTYLHLSSFARYRMDQYFDQILDIPESVGR